MQRIINKTTITVKQGDITKENVDAIVNAAKKSLLGGGGVDGAIHRAAGPGLLEECEKLPVLPDFVSEDSEEKFRCFTGDAKITDGYDLPAKYVIHTVGPDCRVGDGIVVDSRARKLLSECWWSSIDKACLYNIKTIAFPSISTGIYGFPVEEAAQIAIASIRLFFLLYPKANVEKVIIVCFSDEDFNAYSDALCEICKKETPDKGQDEKDLKRLLGVCNDLLDAFWDLSPLEYAASRKLPGGIMSYEEGERIKDRTRKTVREIEERLTWENDND